MRKIFMFVFACVTLVTTSVHAESPWEHAGKNRHRLIFDSPTQHIIFEVWLARDGTWQVGAYIECAEQLRHERYEWVLGMRFAEGRDCNGKDRRVPTSTWANKIHPLPPEVRPLPYPVEARPAAPRKEKRKPTETTEKLRKLT